MPDHRFSDEELGWRRARPIMKGVINAWQPRLIPQDAVSEFTNVDLSDRSRPSLRDGYSEVPAGQVGRDDTTGRITGLGYLDGGASSRLLLSSVSVDEGGQVYYTADPDDNAGWTEAVTSDSVSAGDLGGQVKMFQGNEMMWLVPSNGRPPMVVTTTGELLNLGATNESPPGGVYDGCWLYQRAWFVTRTAIYWSKVYPTKEDLVPDPNAFDQDNNGATGGGSLQLDPPQGARPVAMVPWNEKALIVFYRNSVLQVAVNPSEPSLSSITTIEPNFGAASRDAIVVEGNRIYFMDQYGAFRELAETINAQNQGIIPEPISEPVRATFPKGLSLRQLHKTQAVQFGEDIYIATMTANNADHPSEVWVYNTPTRSWNGRYTFNDLVGRFCVSDIRKDVYELFFGSCESPPKVYRCFDGSYADDGEEITYREVTRAWDFGRPESELDLRYIEVVCKGSGTEQYLLVYARADEDDEWQLLGKEELQVTDGDFPLIEVGFEGSQFPLIEAS